jgi:uncharacterized peroxidase-related enzyme
VSFLDDVTEEEAAGEVAELYDAERERIGYVSNMIRVFSHRPPVYAGWRALLGSVAGNMDARRYELVTLAAARALRSSYCMLAHGEVLLDRFLGADELLAVAADHRSAELDEVDVAVMDLAEQVVRDATAVTQAQIDRLRELGLSDGEILEVAAAAAARCFFSKTLDALGVQADARYAELEPGLRETLVVGRPIADGRAS